MFSIDGVEWKVKCEIQREIEIKESDISGMMMNGVIYRDPLGTYIGYGVALSMPLKNRGRYQQLIDQLSEPVGGHDIIMPHNTETVTLNGKISGLNDVYVTLESGYTYWDGLEFSIEPNTPTYQLSEGEAISRGLPALPPTNEAEIGDTYEWTADGWEEVSALPDADLIAFPRS